ncbi:hypothetical protein C8R44DRAFT_754534 [Mycena epipterygia]|nr:hypothetical protein C8R44DRAFT_754534 [Mycena epipterygia]
MSKRWPEVDLRAYAGLQGVYRFIPRPDAARARAWTTTGPGARAQWYGGRQSKFANNLAALRTTPPQAGLRWCFQQTALPWRGASKTRLHMPLAPAPGWLVVIANWGHRTTLAPHRLSSVLGARRQPELISTLPVTFVTLTIAPTCGHPNRSASPSNTDTETARSRARIMNRDPRDIGVQFCPRPKCNMLTITTKLPPGSTRPCWCGTGMHVSRGHVTVEERGYTIPSTAAGYTARTLESLRSWWSDSNPLVTRGPTVNLHAASKPLMRLLYHRQVLSFIKWNQDTPLSEEMLQICSDYLAYGTRLR